MHRIFTDRRKISGDRDSRWNGGGNVLAKKTFCAIRPSAVSFCCCSAIIYRPLSVPAARQGSCLAVIRSKSQFWSILYRIGVGLYTPAPTASLSLSLSVSLLDALLSLPFLLSFYLPSLFLSLSLSLSLFLSPSTPTFIQ